MSNNQKVLGEKENKHQEQSTSKPLQLAILKFLKMNDISILPSKSVFRLSLKDSLKTYLEDHGVTEAELFSISKDHQQLSSIILQLCQDYSLNCIYPSITERVERILLENISSNSQMDGISEENEESIRQRAEKTHTLFDRLSQTEKANLWDMSLTYQKRSQCCDRYLLNLLAQVDTENTSEQIAKFYNYILQVMVNLRYRSRVNTLWVNEMIQRFTPVFNRLSENPIIDGIPFEQMTTDQLIDAIFIAQEYRDTSDLDLFFCHMATEFITTRPTIETCVFETSNIAQVDRFVRRNFKPHFLEEELSQLKQHWTSLALEWEQTKLRSLINDDDDEIPLEVKLGDKQALIRRHNIAARIFWTGRGVISPIVDSPQKIESIDVTITATSDHKFDQVMEFLLTTNQVQRFEINYSAHSTLITLSAKLGTVIEYTLGEFYRRIFEINSPERDWKINITFNISNNSK